MVIQMQLLVIAHLVTEPPSQLPIFIYLSIWKISFLIFMCVPVFVTHMYTCQRGCQDPKAGVIHDCEPLDVQVLGNKLGSSRKARSSCNHQDICPVPCFCFSLQSNRLPYDILTYTQLQVTFPSLTFPHRCAPIFNQTLPLQVFPLQLSYHMCFCVFVRSKSPFNRQILLSLKGVAIEKYLDLSFYSFQSPSTFSLTKHLKNKQDRVWMQFQLK